MNSFRKGSIILIYHLKNYHLKLPKLDKMMLPSAITEKINKITNNNTQSTMFVYV